MLSKVAQFFLPPGLNIDSIEGWKISALVKLIIAIFCLLSFMYFTVAFGLIHDTFPYLFVLIATGLLLISLKITGNQVLFVNAFALLLFVGSIPNILDTGGIYSYNLRWLIFPVLIAFLFLNLRFALLWMMMVIGLIIIVNFYQTPSHTANLEVLKQQDYFVDNLVFIFTFSCIILIFHSAQSRFDKALNSKNEILKNQKLDLEKKSIELKKLTAQLRDSNKQLENYAHTTAHDLKQPVRTITSFAQLSKRAIEKNKITDQTLEYLDFVINSSSKLSVMINNLLAFAKVNHLESLERHEVDLNTSLKMIKKQLSQQIEENEVSVIINDLPKVKANKIQIERVFQNLISNALKFNKEEIESKVEISHTQQNGHYIFKIKDNGIGIRKESQKSIFNIFNQVEMAKKDGFGIGLSTCQKIVEQHGGKIWVESEFGEGSVFCFTLPRG